MKNPVDSASWLDLPDEVPEEMRGIYAKAQEI